LAFAHERSKLAFLCIGRSWQQDIAAQTKRTHDVIIGDGFLDVEGMFKALQDVDFPADDVLPGAGSLRHC
jgi:hypothetical protein